MAYFLTASSHYLNQCWLVNTQQGPVAFIWSQFTRYTSAINKEVNLKITYPNFHSNLPEVDEWVIHPVSLSAMGREREWWCGWRQLAECCGVYTAKASPFFILTTPGIASPGTHRKADLCALPNTASPNRTSRLGFDTAWHDIDVHPSCGPWSWWPSSRAGSPETRLAAATRRSPQHEKQAGRDEWCPTRCRRDDDDVSGDQGLCCSP